MKTQEIIKNGLIKHYEGVIAMAQGNIQIYMNNSVGVGDHSDHLKEIIKWIKDVANSCCNESVKTASTICDGTRKANAEFVKAFMSNFK